MASHPVSENCPWGLSACMCVLALTMFKHLKPWAVYIPLTVEIAGINQVSMAALSAYSWCFVFSKNSFPMHMADVAHSQVGGRR